MPTIKKTKKGYYELWNKGKFVKHIGDEEKLRVFERDRQISAEAAKVLSESPVPLSPRDGLRIIAAGKKALAGKIALPDVQYKTIVIDPPWPMEKILRDERTNQADFDYSVMELHEICALPVSQAALADGCHVYLWTTQRFLPDAFGVLQAWGVNYECLLTWVKNVGFTPFSFMYSTEHCLFGRIGSLPLLKKGIRLDFQAKVREHSRKPDEFYDIVRTVSPEPRLDWFSREPRAGFDQLGDEVDKFGLQRRPTAGTEVCSPD